MTAKFNTNKIIFAEAFPKFRLLTTICIGYWMVLWVILFSRNDLEMGDTLSFLFYTAMMLTHTAILISTYVSDRFQKGRNIIFYVAIFPLAISIMAILISVFSYAFMILQKVFE